MKLMTILGTRPEIIRLSSIIKKADKYFEHVLVHTGQNFDYELNELLFEELGLREPDYKLEISGTHLGESMGNIISRSYEVIKKERPDAVLILGDTNSSLAAISAKRLKVPIFHMEAGNRCWDWNVPEMVNRTMIDHISDVNLPYTENGRQYLLQEGLNGQFIFVTGSPMYEVINDKMTKINESEILRKLELEKNKYILLSAHREENIDNEENFRELMNSINKLAEKTQLKVIYSTHPRSKKWIKKRKFEFHKLVKLLRPFGFVDYCHLQQNAFVVLSDSGTLTEESAILGFPAVLIRTSTERPEGLDAGTIVVGGIKSTDILQAVELATESHKNKEGFEIPIEYQEPNVSGKVLKIISSYAKIVNEVIWRKK